MYINFEQHKVMAKFNVSATTYSPTVQFESCMHQLMANGRVMEASGEGYKIHRLIARKCKAMQITSFLRDIYVLRRHGSCFTWKMGMGDRANHVHCS